MGVSYPGYVVYRIYGILKLIFGLHQSAESIMMSGVDMAVYKYRQRNMWGFKSATIPIMRNLTILHHMSDINMH